MRKQIIEQKNTVRSEGEVSWLDIPLLAQVEFTSEAEGFPIEAVFKSELDSGWRAARPGAQTIRLLFDTPQHINRIQLLFIENEQPRTQEFVLRWSSAVDAPSREIVRQQYNFNLPNGVQELEEYTVQLQSVALLELYLVPDISNGSACASLMSWRVA